VKGPHTVKGPYTVIGLGRAALLIVFALCGFAAPTQAQRVRLAEDPRTDGQRALQTFLTRDEFALWTRDTVLAVGDTVRSHVLLLEASARIAGRIDGDVYVVDGDLFLRARGSVGGDVVVLAGGFYDSDLAEVEGAITYLPNERIRVRPTQGDFEVISEILPRPSIEGDGTRGLHTPTYQRVDAVTFGFGGLGRATALPGRPELEAVVRYKTGPAEFDGALRNSWYLSDRLRLGLLASRATGSNDGWIRPTWYNGLAHFVAGNDNREYYRTDRIGVEIDLVSPEPPIWEDAPSWRLAFGLSREDALSLPARDVTVLFGDEATTLPEPAAPYPNAAIDDGALYSARAGFEWSMRGREGRIGVGIGLEAGFDDNIAGGNFDFTLVEARISARKPTAWGHAWELFAIGRTDLGGTLPGQRLSTIGGIGTLPTIPLRGLRGGRLLYVDATYAIPLLGMASLGGLDVFARLSAGGTSDSGRPFRLEESLTGGVAVRLWDFQMEVGIAAGSDVGPESVRIVPFFDVRVRRSARPSQMPRRGRSY